MPTKFQYKRRDASAWEKRANQRGGQFESFTLDEYAIYVKKKENNIRILPPTWEGADHYGFDLFVHYSVGPSEDSVICNLHMRDSVATPAEYRKEGCPVCEAAARFSRRGEEEQANELKATKRVCCWVLDNDEPSKGPLVYAMPWTLDRDITMISKDRKTKEILNIDDPEYGYNVYFETTGEKMKTRYVGVGLDNESSAVKQSVLDYITRVPLPNTLRWRTYEEVKLIYEGAGATSDSSRQSTEDENPRQRTHTRPEPESSDDPPFEEGTKSNPREETKTSGKSRADEIRERFGKK